MESTTTSKNNFSSQCVKIHSSNNHLYTVPSRELPTNTSPGMLQKVQSPSISPTKNMSHSTTITHGLHQRPLPPLSSIALPALSSNPHGAVHMRRAPPLLLSSARALNPREPKVIFRIFLRRRRRRPTLFAAGTKVECARARPGASLYAGFRPLSRLVDKLYNPRVQGEAGGEPKRTQALYLRLCRIEVRRVERERAGGTAEKHAS